MPRNPEHLYLMALSSRCFGGLRRLLKKLNGDADRACKAIVDGFASWRGDTLSIAAIAKDPSAFIVAPPRRTNQPERQNCGLTKAKCLERFGDAFGRRLKESGGEQGLFVDCFGGPRK